MGCVWCRDIDHVHDYFQFQIWDRNNLTTRQSDWLMRHREGIHMIYRLHEVRMHGASPTLTASEEGRALVCLQTGERVLCPGVIHCTVGY